MKIEHVNGDSLARLREYTTGFKGFKYFSRGLTPSYPDVKEEQTFIGYMLILKMKQFMSKGDVKELHAGKRTFNYRDRAAKRQKTK
jgi:hypothetical protein